MNAPLTVDVHAHLVSPELPARVRAEGAALGVTCTVGERGVVLSFGEGRNSRPLFDDMTSVARRTSANAAAGIDLQIVSPWVDLFGYALAPDSGEGWSRILNDSIAETIAGRPGFAAMATVPLQDGRRAARELKRAVATHGFVGVEIGTNVDGVSLDDAGLEPFWSACCETNVAVFVHPVDALRVDRIAPFYGWNTVGNPLETLLAATRLILGGVLDRYPALRILLCHGGGHLPYQIGRLDRAHAVRPELRGSSLLPPSAYLRRFHYDTVLNAAPPLRMLLETVGADRVCLGSDLPFDMGDHRPLDLLDELALDRSARDRIAGTNACELFAIEHPAVD